MALVTASYGKSQYRPLHDTELQYSRFTLLNEYKVDFCI